MPNWNATFRVLLALAGVTHVAGAAAQEPPTLRIGWTIPAEETKYLMMRRPELFPELGKSYKIQWIQFQGTTPMVQAMAGGALDCSTQAPLSLAQGALNSGLKAFIVAQHVGEKPGQFSVYWAVKGDSPIRSVADLNGKTIGINVYGSGIAGPLALHLRRHGLDLDKDVKLVETGFPGSEDAIRTGRVDAGVLNQPFASRAEAKGGLRRLFSLADEQKDIVHIMEVCSAPIVEKDPALVRRYVRDLTSAMQLVLADRDRTMKVVSEVTRAPIEVLDTYLLKQNDFHREPGAKPNLAGVQAMFDIYTKAGMIKDKLDVKTFARSDLMAPIGP